MSDPYDLERFVQAQAPVYQQVLAELRAGRKCSHWMWFVFPQLAGLGHSAMAQRYAIASLPEARAYLAHPLLGGRLRECTALVLAVGEKDVQRVFDPPDDLKFHSCMTLFQRAEPAESLFGRCLANYFGGRPDARTVAALDGAPG